MDKETAVRLGFGVASFIPGPIGLTAMGASLAIAAHDAHKAGIDRAILEGASQAWSRRSELASVANAAIGITPAQAQSPGYMRESGQGLNQDVLRGKGKANGEANDPRRKKKTDTESAATPAAPKTAPKPDMPKSAAAPAPTPPVATQPEQPSLKERLFGKSGPSPAERQLEEALKGLSNEQRRLDDELKGRTGRGTGTGPFADKRQQALDKAQEAVDHARRAVEKDQLTVWNYAAGGAAIAAGLLGWRIAGATGARAAKGAVDAVANINTLGRAAAVLNKTKGVLTGSPRGDALKGIVTAGRASQGVVARAGADVAAAAHTLNTKIGGTLLVTGGAEFAGSMYLEDKNPGMAGALRMGSAISLGAVAGLKLGTGNIIASVVPQVGARSAAALKTAESRLAREAAGGAMKASHARVAKEVVGARKELVKASASAKIGVVRGEQAVAGAMATKPVMGKGGKVLTRAGAKAEAAARSAAAQKAIATRAAKHRQQLQLAHNQGRHAGAQDVIRNRALAMQGGKGWTDWARYQAAVKQGHKWKGPIPKRPAGKAPKQLAAA